MGVILTALVFFSLTFSWSSRFQRMSTKSKAKDMHVIVFATSILEKRNGLKGSETESEKGASRPFVLIHATRTPNADGQRSSLFIY